MYVQPFKLHDKQYFSPFYLGRLWYVGFGSIINLIFVHKHVWMKKQTYFYIKNIQTEFVLPIFYSGCLNITTVYSTLSEV